MTLIDLALPYQREVLESKASVKVLNFARQCGKSWTMAFSAVKKAVSMPNQLVMYLSTGQRASDEALKTCLKFCEAVRQLSHDAISYSSNATCITFNNGSRIMSLPSSPNACRGFTISLLLLDEIAFWEHAQDIWTAIIPTLTNRLSSSTKELMICSTPNGKHNLFWELSQKAKFENGWQYFETNIEDAIGMGLKADINALKSLMPDPLKFQQEYMCQFMDVSDQFLNPSFLQTFQQQDEFHYVDFFMGVDFGRKNDATSISIIGRTRDNRLHLVELVNLVNVEYHVQFKTISDMFRKWKPRLCYCDQGGIGGPLTEELNRQVSPLFRGFSFNQTSKTQVFEYLRKTVFGRQLFICEDYLKTIKDELALTHEQDGRIWQDRVAGCHADSIISLALALHAERQNPQRCSLPVSIAPFSVF